MVVFLDAGPLGMVTNPGGSAETRACNEWLDALLSAGVRVLVPEIADYEVRRELMRAEKRAGIARLDALKSAIGYVPLTTDVMLRAASLWAQARQGGYQTADDNALDADVILAAQALAESINGEQSVIATTNIGHLARFVDARLWRNIAY